MRRTVATLALAIIAAALMAAPVVQAAGPEVNAEGLHSTTAADPIAPHETAGDAPANTPTPQSPLPGPPPLPNPIERECAKDRILFITLPLPDDDATCGGGEGPGEDGADDGPTRNVLQASTPAPPAHGTTPNTGVRPSTGSATSVAASSNSPVPAPAHWGEPITLAVLSLVALGALVPWLLRSRKGKDNEVRRAIFDMVCEDPGITASQVADELDVHLTTAIYHLDRLKDDERIEGIREGRSTLYFENHRKYGRMEKRVLTTLKKGTAADLLALVAENPGIHCAELARRLDLSRTSVKWHTDRLTDDGLLVKHPNGGTLELEVPDRTEELLEKYQAA